MLVTKEFKFDSAHFLPEYQGKCEKMHGHTYRLQVTVEAAVGADGLAFDFAEIKKIVESEVIDKLDHQVLNDIIKVPSAENIAIWVWQKLENKLPLYEVKVWETATSFVTYRGKGQG